MVLILSQDSEITTNRVIDWLKFYKTDYVRINQESKKEIIELSIDNQGNETIKILIDDNQIIDLSKISACWYRRGDILISNFTDFSNFTDEDSLNKYLEMKKNHELKIIENYIYDRIKSSKKLCDYRAARINKLIALNYAREVGLKIPETYILTKKTDLIALLNKCGTLITKPIAECLQYRNETSYYQSFTEVIDYDVVKEMNDHFFPSLFQPLLDKKFELQIFYMPNKIHSIAIMSQENDKTKIDFRRYDTEKPNRDMVYNLPKQIQNKIKKLMEKLNDNIGVIDIVVTKKNEYVFLETNPVGQFGGMVSEPGNFNIHKSIAEYLIS